MNINTSFINFKKKHKNKKNQILFHETVCKNNKIIENIIVNNSLTDFDKANLLPTKIIQGVAL